MQEQLFQTLAELRRRVRSLIWLHGLSWMTVTALLTVFVAGTLDWLCQPVDQGVRLLLALSVLGGSGWTCWRFLWRPLRVPFSNLELAQRIERCHPAFSDGLSSTVEFLESRESQHLGSPELQHEVIRQVLARLEDVPVQGILETKPVQRAALIAVGACLIACLLAGFNQAEAATAVGRLLFPFADIPWPRDVELRFVTRDLTPLVSAKGGSLTVAQGETLDLFVENSRGTLPANLTLHSRRPDGRTSTEAMRQTTLWDADGHAREIGGVSLQINNGPLLFRATGGDGETLPLQVDVVPPPRVEKLRIKLDPPEYLGQPPRTLPENVGHIECYSGTKMTLSATGNKPLDRAILFSSDGSRRDSLPLVISKDGLSISGEIVWKEAGAGSWWLQLRDQQGFENPEAPRYELRVTADSIPTVVIENPDSDLTVTATAVVPFKVVARDDIGVTALQLSWQISGTEAGLNRELSDNRSGSEPKTAEASDKTAGVLTEPMNPGSSGTANVDGVTETNRDLGKPTINPEVSQSDRIIRLFDATTLNDAELNDLKQVIREHQWNLASHQFAAGTKIVVTAEARDGCTIGEPHIGHSNPRTIIIVDAEQKRSELQERQGALVLELERAAAMQQKARQFVGELRLQLDQTGTLRPEDLDLLKRVELDQRQIESRLADPRDGVEQRARSIRQERESNQIEDAGSKMLLDGLISELEFLGDEPLPEIERRLTEARKLGASGLEQRDAKRQINDALAAVARRQEDASRTLEKALGELARWKSDRNLNADLRSLSGEQQELSAASKELGQKTLTKPFGSLTAQEKADLERLAARQRQMAERVDVFRQALDTAAKELQESEPDRADALKNALQKLDEAGLAGEMRQVAADIRQNRIGEALNGQQDVTEEMRKLQDLIDEREVTDVETLVKQLAEAGQQLQSLHQQQSELMQKLDEASGQPAAEREQTLQKLRREQEQLRKQLGETLRRLKRMQSPAADAADRAAQRMRQAEAELGENDSASAQRETQEALDDLEQAERELARDKQQAEDQLAREAIEKIADQLKSLLARQEATIAETQRLQKEYDSAGKWSRTLLKSLVNLGEVQTGLKDETTAAAERVAEVEAVALALRSAAKSMERGVQRIAERDVSAQTVALQEKARQRFAQLVEALADPDQKDAQSQPQQSGEPPDGPQDAGPEGDRFPIVAQLKIIRSLQEELIERGDGLRSRIKDGSEISEADQQELAEMADEQAELADLIRKLTDWFGDPAEAADNPETESGKAVPLN